MTKTLVLDTETTGGAKADQVIELAYIELNSLKEEIEALQTCKEDNILSSGYIPAVLYLISNERYKPSCKINPRAYDVHGISYMQLINCPKARTISLPDEIDYIIGHNISFDKRMLEQTNPDLKDKLDKVKYICTLALAKVNSKYSDIKYENHKLDTLAKHYYPEHEETLSTEFHSAQIDVLKTLLVLLAMVESFTELETYEDVWNFQQSLKNFK